MTVTRGNFTFYEDGSVRNSNGTKYHVAGFDDDKNVIYAYDSSKSSYVGINSDGSLSRLRLSDVPAKITTPSAVGNTKIPNQQKDYSWIDNERHPDPNVASGFETASPTPSSNQYFKTEAEWQAPGRGTGLNYKVYQQEIDLDARPIKGSAVTNAQLMQEGRAPFVLKNGQYEQLQLHHSRQDGRGALFETSKLTHLGHTNQDGRQALHPYGSAGHPDYPVNHTIFDKDRNQYWKDRLNQLRGE